MTIPRSDDERPVLGDPPEPPAATWERAIAGALDPWANPLADLLPTDDVPTEEDVAAQDDGEHADPGPTGSAWHRDDDADDSAVHDAAPHDDDDHV